VTTFCSAAVALRLSRVLIAGADWAADMDRPIATVAIAAGANQKRFMLFFSL
jgi:hypothetical protein